MVWEAIAALAALATLLVTVVAWAHTNGKLTQKVEDNRKDTEAHAERLDDIDQRLNSNDVKIAKLEAWKDGYNAAVAARAHEPSC